MGQKRQRIEVNTISHHLPSKTVHLANKMDEPLLLNRKKKTRISADPPLRASMRPGSASTHTLLHDVRGRPIALCPMQPLALTPVNCLHPLDTEPPPALWLSKEDVCQSFT